MVRCYDNIKETTAFMCRVMNVLVNHKSVDKEAELLTVWVGWPLKVDVHITHHLNRTVECHKRLEQGGEVAEELVADLLQAWPVDGSQYKRCMSASNSAAEVFERLQFEFGVDFRKIYSQLGDNGEASVIDEVGSVCTSTCQYVTGGFNDIEAHALKLP